MEISGVQIHTATSVYALIPLCIEVENTSISGAGQQSQALSFLLCCGRKELYVALFPFQHSVQLVKVEKKMFNLFHSNVSSVHCLPSPFSSSRNTFVLDIMLSWCKYCKKTFLKPHSSLLVKNVTKSNEFIYLTQKLVLRCTL